MKTYVLRAADLVLMNLKCKMPCAYMTSLKPVLVQSLAWKVQKGCNKMKKTHSALGRLDLLHILGVIFGFPFFFLMIFKVRLSELIYPFSYDADGLLDLSVIKSLINNGWYLKNEFLGTPFAQLHYDYPVPDGFLLLLIKGIGLFTKNHFLVFNLFFLITYAMVGLVTYLCFRLFKVASWLSLAGSFIFTFLPYHQLRLQHFFLADYFSVPLYTVLAFFCFDPQRDFSRKRAVFLVFVAFVLSSSGLYYAFFGSLFIAVCGVLGAVSSRTMVPMRRAVGFVGVVSIGLLVNALPSLIYRYREYHSPEVVQRVFIEAELYGLKIIQLLLPTPNHRIRFLSFLNQRYSSISPLVNENQTATLGVLGSIGFIALLGNLFFGFKKDKISQFFTQMNLVALFYGTIGGFGCLFAFFVSPEIRGLNRISVFVAFFSIFALIYWIDSRLKECAFRLKGFLVPAFSLILILVAAYDQTNGSQSPDIHRIVGGFKAEKEFFELLDSKLQEGTKIFQLPYVPYPETPPLQNEGSYGLLKPYLHSRKIKWSYGSMKGTKEDLWLRSLGSMKVSEAIPRLEKAGFSGVLVERRAYMDSGAAIESELSKRNGEMLVSPDKNYSFFHLKPSLTTEIDQNIPFDPVLSKGWCGWESDVKSKWAWAGRKATLMILNISREPRKFKVRFRVEVMGPRKLNIRSVGDSVNSLATLVFPDLRQQEIELDLIVPPRGLALELESDKDGIVPGHGDNRSLGFRIIDFVSTVDSQQPAVQDEETSM